MTDDDSQDDRTAAHRDSDERARGGRLVRISAFARRELVSTIRQPRLILTLVLGPFLILFVFGLGYSQEFPTLTTVVVGPDDSPLTQQIDDYVTEAEVTGIDYIGTTTDEDQAIADLKAGEIDLVVILPDIQELDASEQREIEVHQRKPDPVTTAQIEVAAQTAVAEINDQIVAQAVSTIQDEASGLTEQLDQARSQVDDLRETVSDDDLETIQRNAGPLADRLEQLASQLGQAGPLLEPLGVSGSGQLAEDMRSGAEALRLLAQTDAVGELDRADETLARADEAVAMLQETDPEVLAEPFTVQVYRQTPVAITLDRYYAPGLLALMLQHVAITFVALGMVRERRQGTSELLRVTPVGTTERLIGTSTAHLLLGGAVATVLTGLIVLAFQVPAPVNWGAFAGLVSLALLASLGYGFLVASAAKSDSQAVQFSMLLLITAVFFSGMFLPLDRIQVPVIWVSWLLPTTHAFQGLQELMLLGLPVSSSVWLWLGGMSLVLLGLARLLVPWRDRSG